MGRRLQELEERAAGELRAAKQVLLRLDAPLRARILAWLVYYSRDDGQLYPPKLPQRRRRVTIDGVEYRLVAIPGRIRSHLPHE